MYIVANLVACKNFKHTHEWSPTRLRLGLRASPLIGDIQICILRYVLQVCPIIGVHIYVCVLRVLIK